MNRAARRLVLLPLLLAAACNVGAERQVRADGNGAKSGPKGILGTVASSDAPLASANAAAPAAAARPAEASAAPSQAGVSATAPPAAGSAQRAAIMDALRPAIERKLGGAVEFVIKRVGVQDGWALVIADPQRPGGGRINPRRHFPNEVIEFMDGLTINAILRFSGGGWTLVDHAIGPTDVWYCGVEGPPQSLTGC
jgi:hypothetical protein